MRLEEGMLCIRDAEADDSAQLVKWWNDGSVMAHAGFPKGLDTTEEQVRENLARCEQGPKKILMILFQETVIGEMNYDVRDAHTAEIGIKICEKEYQNRGLGRTVLRMLLRELFSMGYEKIVLDTNLKNQRAQHVYELLGFQKLRVRENSWVDQVGELQSSVEYELTPDHFRDSSD